MNWVKKKKKKKKKTRTAQDAKVKGCFIGTFNHRYNEYKKATTTKKKEKSKYPKDRLCLLGTERENKKKK